MPHEIRFDPEFEAHINRVFATHKADGDDKPFKEDTANAIIKELSTSSGMSWRRVNAFVHIDGDLGLYYVTARLSPLRTYRVRSGSGTQVEGILWYYVDPSGSHSFKLSAAPQSDGSSILTIDIGQPGSHGYARFDAIWSGRQGGRIASGAWE